MGKENRPKSLKIWGYLFFSIFIILIASGLTTTPTAVVLTGITIYATSKGICYFHDNSKDQLIDDGTINDGTIDDTTADNHNSNIFGQSAHKVSTLSMIGFPRTL